MHRVNYRGRRVLFPLGAVLVAAAGVALATEPSRWLVFLCGVGLLGLLDDLVGTSPRGFRGHGLAVVRGELSTGAIKALGTLALAVYADPGGAGEVLVLVLSAHLGNLLDSRPGRIEKGFALGATALCLSTWDLAPLEPIGALLVPVALCAWLTLRERAMLGDAGASLIGGMLGVCLVTALGGAGILAALAGLVAISLYGEFRSLGRTVERVPLLQRLDSLGRSS